MSKSKQTVEQMKSELAKLEAAKKAKCEAEINAALVKHGMALIPTVQIVGQQMNWSIVIAPKPQEIGGNGRPKEAE